MNEREEIKEVSTEAWAQNLLRWAEKYNIRSRFPQKQKDLLKLTTLDLRRCSSLESLPAEIGNLTNLTYLDLRMCSSLESLPAEIENLTRLEKLDLSECPHLKLTEKQEQFIKTLKRNGFDSF